MLIFIILSLGLCFVEQSSESLELLLISPIFLYVGLVIALIGIVSMFFKKLPIIVGYELFSSGTLILWYAHWKTEFNPDSPIFFAYPLYFALMSAFFTLFLSDQGHRIDKSTLGYMKYLDEERILPAWTLMVFVLGSLELRQHYQLYPVLMTLLMLRFTFSSCLSAD
jgi:hypothetical protein